MSPAFRWFLLVLFSPIILMVAVAVFGEYLLSSAIDGEWK